MTWLCRRQCIKMRAPWVGQTDDGIYDVTIVGHQMLRSHTQYHPHSLPGVHQSVNQAKQISIASYVANEPNSSHCAKTAHHQCVACRDCLPSIQSSFNNRLWKFKDRLRNNSSFTSLAKTSMPLVNCIVNDGLVNSITIGI